MPAPRPRVVIVRGKLATPWELRPWEGLTDAFDVRYLLTERNAFDVSTVALDAIRVRTLSDRLPAGRLGEVLSGVVGERYLGLEDALAGADIVHAEELSFWFAAETARARQRDGASFKLVQTVWETIPFLDAYRNRHARAYRREVLAATDLFLPATERARDGLRLEGVAEERMEVCGPGIELGRFQAAARPDPPPAEHLVLSPGRLVWEKGHQDVLRALAALHRGLVTTPDGRTVAPRLLMVGRGPEEERLLRYASELGIADAVEVRSVPYDAMPSVYAEVSCMVLASLPMATGGYHPFDVPRVFWEEQFGLVLAEAMAAGLAIVTTLSGAIPEVVGPEADLVYPGDWMGIARALAAGPLSRPPAARVAHDPARLERFSTRAAAERLRAIYERLVDAERTRAAS
jgi:glycosyltransferase involved in cell wall biosynthesis